ncbi:MAG: LapA family protein [Betaproteobacteria bacterium]|nr:LapA family protein [Betaproteobacteria bacterium]MCC7217494.1 LapA family protein [Burkholderiales bacterium]
MQIARWIVGSAVFLALLFLSLQNADPVTLRFFQLASWQAPLVFVVFVAFASGVAAGLLAGALRASRLKRQLNRLRREHRSGAPRDASLAAGAAPGAAPASGPGFTRLPRMPDGL